MCSARSPNACLEFTVVVPTAVWSSSESVAAAAALNIGRMGAVRRCLMIPGCGYLRSGRCDCLKGRVPWLWRSEQDSALMGQRMMTVGEKKRPMLRLSDLPNRCLLDWKAFRIPIGAAAACDRSFEIRTRRLPKKMQFNATVRRDTRQGLEGFPRYVRSECIDLRRQGGCILRSALRRSLRLPGSSGGSGEWRKEDIQGQAWASRERENGSCIKRESALVGKAVSVSRQRVWFSSSQRNFSSWNATHSLDPVTAEIDGKEVADVAQKDFQSSVEELMQALASEIDQDFTNSYWVNSRFDQYLSSVLNVWLESPPPEIVRSGCTQARIHSIAKLAENYQYLRIYQRVDVLNKVSSVIGLRGIDEVISLLLVNDGSDEVIAHPARSCVSQKSRTSSTAGLDGYSVPAHIHDGALLSNPMADKKVSPSIIASCEAAASALSSSSVPGFDHGIGEQEKVSASPQPADLGGPDPNSFVSVASASSPARSSVAHCLQSSDNITAEKDVMTSVGAGDPTGSSSSVVTSSANGISVDCSYRETPIAPDEILVAMLCFDEVSQIQGVSKETQQYPQSSQCMEHEMIERSSLAAINSHDLYQSLQDGEASCTQRVPLELEREELAGDAPNVEGETGLERVDEGRLCTRYSSQSANQMGLSDRPCSEKLDETGRQGLMSESERVRVAVDQPSLFEMKDRPSPAEDDSLTELMTQNHGVPEFEKAALEVSGEGDLTGGIDPQSHPQSDLQREDAQIVSVSLEETAANNSPALRADVVSRTEQPVSTWHADQILLDADSAIDDHPSARPIKQKQQKLTPVSNEPGLTMTLMSKEPVLKRLRQLGPDAETFGRSLRVSSEEGGGSEELRKNVAMWQSIDVGFHQSAAGAACSTHSRFADDCINQLPTETPTLHSTGLLVTAQSPTDIKCVSHANKDIGGILEHEAASLEASEGFHPSYDDRTSKMLWNIESAEEEVLIPGAISDSPFLAVKQEQDPLQHPETNIVHEPPPQELSACRITPPHSITGPGTRTSADSSLSVLQSEIALASSTSSSEDIRLSLSSSITSCASEASDHFMLPVQNSGTVKLFTEAGCNHEQTRPDACSPLPEGENLVVTDIASSSSSPEAVLRSKSGTAADAVMELGAVLRDGRCSVGQESAGSMDVLKTEGMDGGYRKTIDGLVNHPVDIAGPVMDPSSSSSARAFADLFANDTVTPDPCAVAQSEEADAPHIAVVETAAVHNRTVYVDDVAVAESASKDMSSLSVTHSTCSVAQSDAANAPHIGVAETVAVHSRTLHVDHVVAAEAASKDMNSLSAIPGPCGVTQSEEANAPHIAVAETVAVHKRTASVDDLVAAEAASEHMNSFNPIPDPYAVTQFDAANAPHIAVVETMAVRNRTVSVDDIVAAEAASKDMNSMNAAELSGAQWWMHQDFCDPYREPAENPPVSHSQLEDEEAVSAAMNTMQLHARLSTDARNTDHDVAAMEAGNDFVDVSNPLMELGTKEGSAKDGARCEHASTRQANVKDDNFLKVFRSDKADDSGNGCFPVSSEYQECLPVGRSRKDNDVVSTNPDAEQPCKPSIRDIPKEPVSEEIRQRKGEVSSGTASWREQIEAVKKRRKRVERGRPKHLMTSIPRDTTLVASSWNDFKWLKCRWSEEIHLPFVSHGVQEGDAHSVDAGRSEEGGVPSAVPPRSLQESVTALLDVEPTPVAEKDEVHQWYGCYQVQLDVGVDAAVMAADRHGIDEEQPNGLNVKDIDGVSKNRARSSKTGNLLKSFGEIGFRDVSHGQNLDGEELSKTVVDHAKRGTVFPQEVDSVAMAVDRLMGRESRQWNADNDLKGRQNEKKKVGNGEEEGSAELNMIKAVYGESHRSQTDTIPEEAKRGKKKQEGCGIDDKWVLDTSVKSLRCFTVGQRAKLMSAGFYTLRSLVEHYPKMYVEYRQGAQEIRDGEYLTVTGTVEKSTGLALRGPLGILQVTVVLPVGSVGAEKDDEAASSLSTPESISGSKDVDGVTEGSLSKGPDHSPRMVRVHLKRFFRGRFANRICLTAMANKYPLGKTVAVSGKVKAMDSENDFEMTDFEIRVVSGQTEESDETNNGERDGADLRGDDEASEGDSDGDEDEMVGKQLQKRQESSEGADQPTSIYSSKGGLPPRTIASFVEMTLGLIPADVDPIPEEIRQTYGLMNLYQAYKAIHRPSSLSEAEEARQRLVFDEFFYQQLSKLLQRQMSDESVLAALGVVLDEEKRRIWALNESLGHQSVPHPEWSTLAQQILKALPFTLTRSQQRVASEIIGDLRKPLPMSRLLQGDVGCGKTVVAFLALLEVLAAGFQGAVMAPTEFLAMQHFEQFKTWLKVLDDEAIVPRVELLTGSMPVKKGRIIRQGLRNGDIALVVGTHSLISEGTEFANLGMAVIDEQHRFGVEQRARLNRKGRGSLKSDSLVPPEAGEESWPGSRSHLERIRDGGSAVVVGAAPHVLAMSATPIPRSLALALHGEMSLSQIDERLPNQSPIKTFVMEDKPEQRVRAYKMVRDAVLDGGRAFVVFPLIAESELVQDVRAATVEFERLRENEFAGIRCGLVHGRMQAAEKEGNMKSFKDGTTDILFSTTVIEVGIDIPEATVMLVEHADRYGMAQLHQLRGRVGRGDRPSVCILLASSSGSMERLRGLENSQDGFYLAEMDLRHRGPGELLGKKQSGHLPEFVLARWETDGHLMESARAAASEILSKHIGLHDLPQLRQELNMRVPVIEAHH